MRSFQRSWQTAYPWLVYSESEDGGFYKYCMLFAEKLQQSDRYSQRTPQEGVPHRCVSKGREFHQDRAETPESNKFHHRYSKINPDREKSEAAAQYHLVHSLLR